MRTALGFFAHHVVRRDLRAEDRVDPILRGEELVLVQHVGRACDVSGDEDAVGHNAMDIEGAASSVTGDAPKAGG